MRVLKVNSKVQLNSGKVVKIPYLKAFVMEVKTDNAGTSNDNQFTIPTTGTGYDYTVLRCDSSGNVLQRLENQTGDVTLTWVVAGTYIVKIVPKSDGSGFPRVYFNNGGDKLKLLDWQQVGTVAWTSMERSFRGCNNMVSSFTDIPDLSGVSSFSSAFIATQFDSPVNQWNFSTITDFSFCFYNTPFNQPLNGIDISNNESFYATFFAARLFNQPLNLLNTGKITNMAYMLRSADSFKQDIGMLDIANVADFTDFLSRSDINNPDSTTNQDNYNALLVGWATRPTYSITKLESDGVNTKATAAGHGLVVGNTITITGTTNYNGVHEVLSVDGDTFTFDTAFIADETGTVRKDLKSNSPFHGGNSKYSGAEATAARAFLISEYNWSITDGGLA